MNGTGTQDGLTGRSRVRRLWLIGPHVLKVEYITPVYIAARWQNPYNVEKWPRRCLWRRVTDRDIEGAIHEVAALRSALEHRTIRQHDGGAWCDLCERRVDGGEDHQHGAACLLHPDRKPVLSSAGRL